MDVLIEDQDSVGLPWNWLYGVSSLCCIFELFTKHLDITERSKHVADIPHRMMSEGDEREVSGEGIPPGGEGRLSQSVPEDSHPLPFSLQQGALWEAEGAVGDPVHEVQRDPLDLLTVEHDKVVLHDQESIVCDENKTLFLIVPVIHLCHQPNAVNAAVYFFIHQSFDVCDGLIQSARPQHKEPLHPELAEGGLCGPGAQPGLCVLLWPLHRLLRAGNGLRALRAVRDLGGAEVMLLHLRSWSAFILSICHHYRQHN